MLTIGEKLKQARGEKTRKEVCKALGISRSTLMMYENGKRVPKDKIKKQLAEYYRRSIEDLFF